MIWSKKFFAKIDQENKEILGRYYNHPSTVADVFRVGIIGGGPKGIYAIEKLVSLWANSTKTQQLEITCFNTDASFAAGNNYNTTQPDFLLINYSLGNIDFWIDEPIQLVKNRPNLVEFINNHKFGTNETAQPLDFCSRATTGIYLQYCFRKVLEAIPSNITVNLREEKVIDLEKFENSYDVVTETTSYSKFSELLFCTGHAYKFADKLTKKYKSFAKSNSSTVFIPHIYPVQNLYSIPLHSKTVLVQGLGLTFVDAVLALTEGLGGTFDSNGGRLIYHPSGREPKSILPFSRTGIPMLARKPGLKEKLELRYFTEDFVGELAKGNSKIDFEEDVLPVVILEYRYQFTNKFLEIVGYSRQFDKKQLELLELEQLVGIVFPDFKPFDFQEFIEPKDENPNHHEFVLNYLENSVYPGSRPVQQALNAMTSVWRAIHPLFNNLYRFGKLKGQSQDKFDSFYFGRLSRVSYGPPIASMKKILALAESGILNFTISKNPQINTDNKTGFYDVTSLDGKNKIEADILIDARIAKASGKESLPLIYQKLMDRFALNVFENENYQTSCLALDQNATLIGLPEITLYGTPTEGWTLDNESLSRNNNNFISPWASRLVKKYVKATPKIKRLSSLMD